MSIRIVSTAINHEKFSHKFKFSVIVKNMYEHKVVGPINQVKNYEDAWEEVESHLKINNISGPSFILFICFNISHYDGTAIEGIIYS